MVEPKIDYGEQCPLIRQICTHEGRGRCLEVEESRKSVYGAIALGRWKTAAVCEGFELGEYKRIGREATAH